MPGMAAIVSKKADETTTITYDALAPSAGDGVKAQWRQDTGAVATQPVGHRATMSMATVWNGAKTARRSVIEYKRPYSYLNSTTGRYEATDAVVGRLEITVPVNMPASEISEGVIQFLNALTVGGSLIKTSVISGYAPT